MKGRLFQCFRLFEARLQRQVKVARREGSVPPKTPLTLHIVGQMALIVSDLPIPVAGTTDLDAIGLLEYPAATLLRALLLDIGLTLETDQHLIWMPSHTKYHPWYRGPLVRVDIADPLFVIASKCKFQRAKDRALLAQYFAVFPEARKIIERMRIATSWITP